MSRNFLACSAGIVLGLVIGFFVANGISRPSTTLPNTVATNDAGPGSAGPLDPSETTLPPNHPPLEGAGTGSSSSAGSAVSTSPAAQAAMEKADRNAKDFDAQVAAAKTFYDLHDYKKSALYYERALALKPKDYTSLVGLANSRYDDGDFAAAAPFYERALEIKRDADVQTDLGNTFFRRTPPDFDRAILEYRKATAINSSHENAWKNLAAAAINKGDKATASEALSRLAEINPRSPELDSLRAALAARQ